MRSGPTASAAIVQDREVPGPDDPDDAERPAGEKRLLRQEEMRVPRLFGEGAPRNAAREPNQLAQIENLEDLRFVPGLPALGDERPGDGGCLVEDGVAPALQRVDAF
jgi:hypothetical protein